MHGPISVMRWDSRSQSKATICCSSEYMLRHVPSLRQLPEPFVMGLLTLFVYMVEINARDLCQRLRCWRFQESSRTGAHYILCRKSDPLMWNRESEEQTAVHLKLGIQCKYHHWWSMDTEFQRKRRCFGFWILDIWESLASVGRIWAGKPESQKAATNHSHLRRISVAQISGVTDRDLTPWRGIGPIGERSARTDRLGCMFFIADPTWWIR
jgi:hypothetical protein